MQRRKFIQSTLLGAGALALGHQAWPAVFGTSPLNKRERMLRWLEGKTEASYRPAAFFLHFDEKHKVGSAAAKKHLEYFRYTEMDFVKIQYEQAYTPLDFLRTPADWAKLQPNSLDFYAPQLQTVREIVKAAKKEALIIMTLYSPFMWAGHCATLPVLLRHMEEDPDAVKKGLDILTESQLLFARACMKIGVDGFYMSTQGSETKQLSDPRLFKNYVKPSDLVAMQEVSSKCPFNILHVCDYNGIYANYDAVLDYPGQVVNCNPQLTDKLLSWKEISTMFKRPAMGGMQKNGVLSKGNTADISLAVQDVLKNAPEQFILGAECTVPGNTDWNNLKLAIKTAHQLER